MRPKLRALTRLLAAHPPAAMLVFCSTQATAEQVLVHLASKRVKCAGLLASMKNRERAAALRRMRDGRAQVLVATEHASRGLDLPRLSHVVNFDPPKTATSYVHRAGRVGRIGSPEGLVVSFVAGEPVPGNRGAELDVMSAADAAAAGLGSATTVTSAGGDASVVEEAVDSGDDMKAGGEGEAGRNVGGDGGDGSGNTRGGRGGGLLAVPERGVQLMEVARAVGARGGGLRWAVLREN